MDRLEQRDAPVDEGDTVKVTEYTLEEWIEAGTPADAAVRVMGDADLEAHYGALRKLPRVIVEFPAFTDGRGFSHARKLRELGAEGAIVAAGDVLEDQWQFLQRCGFSAMESAEHETLDLPGFSDAYQGDVNQPIPLFRRRPRS